MPFEQPGNNQQNSGNNQDPKPIQKLDQMTNPLSLDFSKLTASNKKKVNEVGLHLENSIQAFSMR